MKPLAKRVVASLLLLPPIIFVLSRGPRWGAGILVLAAVLGARELSRLSRARGFEVPAALPAAGAVLVLLSQSGWIGLSLSASLAVVTLGALVVELFRKGGNMLGGMPLVLLSALYLGLLPGHLLRFYDLGDRPGDPRPVYFALALVWASDTAAFLAGTAWGRHKLWPRVSPGKSWEGAVGGLLAPVALAVLLGNWIAGLSLPGRIGAGLVVGAGAQIGDLAESLMKREAGLKDSGRSIPGHGGVLDRLDSLLVAVPLLYYWLRFSVKAP